jgi:hypothetical protein
MAIIYAINYMQFTSFPIVFQQGRGWAPGIAGLAFTPMGTGAVFGLSYIIFVETPRYAKKHRRLHYLPPEARLTTTLIGSILMPYVLSFTLTSASDYLHLLGRLLRPQYHG